MKIRITKTEGLFPETPAPYNVYLTAFKGIEVDATENVRYPDHYAVEIGRVIDALAEKGYLGEQDKAICGGPHYWGWFRLISNSFTACNIPKDCCEVARND